MIIHKKCWYFGNTFRLVVFLLLVSILNGKANAQIWEPEGLNLPGAWNGWTNPPVNNLALASYTQVPGGEVIKITSGTPRWQTTIKVAASGGDVVGGTYPFLFTSGPSGSPWQNTWKDVTVVMNTLQDYTYNGTADDQVTVVNGRWYTINWQDNGYAPSKAIFMETSAEPVSITGVTQSPLPGQVLPGQNVTVSISLSNTPCPEEKFYVRYSNNGFSTSSLADVNITGTVGTAVIPATTGNVSYYVFSTTVISPSSNHYMYAMRVNDNNGANYSFSYNTATVNVTFKVDMTYQTVAATGVHLVGDFQGWNTSATPMAHIGNQVYSVTLAIAGGGYQEYKFLNGDSYAGEETVPAACGTDNGSGGFNRFFTVPMSDTVMNAICFSSCVPCSSLVPVTFSVDMSTQTVSADGVHLAGDFQGWNPGSTLMTPGANSIYSVTVTVENNTYHEYKFINGNNWSGAELVPSECGVDDGSGGYNRFFTANQSNPTLDLVCFSSCAPCGPLLPVTFWLDMGSQAVSPDGIHLVGDFQGWDPAATPMNLFAGNVYTLTVPVPGNSSYEYKFINGNTWAGEEIVPAECGTDNGSGGFNRFFETENTAVALPEVCFSMCTDCPPPAQLINVTFRVDMSEQTVSPQGIHLAGDFQGWDPDSTSMSPGSNGIYQVTLALEANTTREFKFINGDSWDGEESVPAECGVDNGNGGYNRFINLPENDTILTAVCFNSCNPCPAPPLTSMVSFRVDMQDQEVSPDGIHIVGNFQGWDPVSTPMTQLVDGIYEANIILEEGTVAEYKFINGNTLLAAEIVPEACGTDDGNGGFNRFLTVPVNDTTLAALCFGSCEICHVGTPEIFARESSTGKLWPNPAEHTIHLEYSLDEPAVIQSRIFNTLGVEMIPSTGSSFQEGPVSIVIEVSQLPSGWYVLNQVITRNKRTDSKSFPFFKQ